jgi:polyhydroxybutyrate depolymerase
MERQKRSLFRRPVLLAVIGLLVVSIGVVAWRSRLRATVTYGSLVVDGRERTYRLATPRAPEDGPPLPLVYAFHGTGDDGDFMAGCTKLDELAATERFLLAYPEGILGGWKIFKPAGEPDEENIDVAFFDALHRKLLADCNVDPTRVYAVGHSAGGAWVHLLAASRSDKIAAIVAHSGWLPDRMKPAINATRPYPVMIVQGVDDTQVTLRQADECRWRYEAEGHEVEQVTVEGLGHAWAVSHNAEFWQFLSRFQL